MNNNPVQLKIAAEAKKHENRKFLNGFTKKQRRVLDELFHKAHYDIFEKTDCLNCANCCKTLGPRLSNTDVERIAKALRKKPAQVIDIYLKTDEDGDLVFKTMPCPFLAHDNYCTIYENRPKACREYPHTDQTNIYQIRSLTVLNSYTCPAVFEILERVKSASCKG